MSIASASIKNIFCLHLCLKNAKHKNSFDISFPPIFLLFVLVLLKEDQEDLVTNGD